jgi:hypothetical protein
MGENIAVSGFVREDGMDGKAERRKDGKKHGGVTLSEAKGP